MKATNVDIPCIGIFIPIENYVCVRHHAKYPYVSLPIMKATRFVRRAYLPNYRPIQPRPSSTALRTLTSGSPLPVGQSPLLQLLSRNSRRTSVRHLFQKRLSSSKPQIDPTPHLNSPEPSLSLSQRFRKLSREYGWSALGVYLFLSALDFPFCFLAVKWLGTDRIGHWEHVIVEWIRSVIPASLLGSNTSQAVEIEGIGKAEEYGVIDAKNAEVGLPAYDHGVKEAEKLNQSENASELCLPLRGQTF